MTSSNEHTLHRALMEGAISASILNLELTGDMDAPLRPESLVQIETARALSSFGWSEIELEAKTDKLIKMIRWSPVSDLEGKKMGEVYPNYPVERPGAIDIVCYENSMPSILIEVKDEIVDTGADIIEDIRRLD